MSDPAQLPPPPPLPGAPAAAPTAPAPVAKAPRGHKKVKGGLTLSEQESVRLQQALYAGFVIYLQNPGISIIAVWESGAISAEDNAPLIRDCIAQRTFLDSAIKMGWAGRRDRHWSEVRGRVEAKLMDQHVERTLKELGDLEGLGTVLLQHIRGDAAAGIKPVQPRSLEGAVKAFVDVAKVKLDMRAVVVKQTADAAKAGPGAVGTDPQLPGAGAANLVSEDDGFNDAEIEEMARAAAMRNALGGGRKLIEAPPALAPEPPSTGGKSDNETLARPVMEPL